MGINVKNIEVEQEIRLLASELNVGLTDAIFDAVRQRRASLARERDEAKQVEFDRRMAAIRRIQDQLRPLIKPSMTSNCDEFYDENGFPA
jgi:hypothetical protein